MGTIKIKKMQDFSWWFQKEIVTFVSASDSMVIVPLSTGQIANMNVFGPKKIDVEMLTDTKLTLFDNQLNSIATTISDKDGKYTFKVECGKMYVVRAEKEDYTLIDELYTLLLHPYEEQPEMEKWFTKRPDWARQKIGSSMLSCSS